MKYSLIGAVVLAIVLAVLYVGTGGANGNKNSSESGEMAVPSASDVVPDGQTEPAGTKKNFNF